MLNIYHTSCDRSQFNGFKVISALADPLDFDKYQEQLITLSSAAPVLFDFSELSGEDLINSLIIAQGFASDDYRSNFITSAICSEKISDKNKTPLNKVHYHF